MRASIRTKMVFTGLALVYLFCFIGLHPGMDPVKGQTPILHSDGVGLYDYLPRLFLHHQLEYTGQERAFVSTDEQGHHINRFFCGTALLEMPFFMGGAVYAKLFGYVADGYSPPFQYAIGLSAVFYSLWGLYLLFLLLVRYFGCSETNGLWTVVFTAVGTNLVFYSTWSGSFSHAFSFFAITAFLYRAAVTAEWLTVRNLFTLTLLFGLVVLIRPVNGMVILLVPALFTGKKELLHFVKALFRTRFLLAIGVAAFIPVFIQCWIWYMQTGEWIKWSYRQEGFYFLHPHITEVLFGFRRGLLVYCPLLLLCLPGLVAGLKFNRWVTVWLLVFLLVFTYVTASWWHWTYGDTFGMRPFVDVLPVWMILFAFSLVYLVRARKILLSAAVIFTVFNLVFCWQFLAGITNLSTMNAEKFFSLFMRTSAKYEQLYGGCNDLPPYAPHGFKTLHSFNTGFDDAPGGVLHVQGDEFVASTECIYPIAEKNTRHLWITVRYKRKLVQPPAMKQVLFVFHALDSHVDSTITYRATRVKEDPVEAVGQWETVELRLWLPDAVDAENRIRTYLWNSGKETFYLDDYSVLIQVPRW